MTHEHGSAKRWESDRYTCAECRGGIGGAIAAWQRFVGYVTDLGVAAAEVGEAAERFAAAWLRLPDLEVRRRWLLFRQYRIVGPGHERPSPWGSRPAAWAEYQRRASAE